MIRGRRSRSRGGHITHHISCTHAILLSLCALLMCGLAGAVDYGAITVTPANCAEWSTNLSNNVSTVQGDIIVNDGAVLSIEGASVKMRRISSNNYPTIIVKNNGTLNINDSEITRGSTSWPYYSRYYDWRYENGSRGNLTNSTVTFCIQSEGFVIETNETVSLFNVTFDHGHQSHPSNCYAIYLNSASNASIRACTIKTSSSNSGSTYRYTYGIYMHNSKLCNLKDNIIEEKGSYRHGIHLQNSDNNTLINNSITRGTYSSTGCDAIHLESSFNNTLRDTMIAGSANQDGIHAVSSNNTTILNSTIDRASDYGIHIQSSQFCNLSENHVTDGTDAGIYVQNADSVTLLSNNLSGNGDGIYLDSADDAILTGNSVNGSSRYGINITSSRNCTLRSNAITDCTNYYHLYVTGDAGDYNQDIDTSNTVNGGKVYYNYTDSGTITDTNIGHVTIVDCTNLWFTGCTIHNGDGIRIRGDSSNVSISGGTIEDNTVCGINLESTRYNNITSVNITNNAKQGVYLYNSSNNTVNKSNILNNSEYGVYSKEPSSHNRIIENNVTNNTRGGISLHGLGHNEITDNNVSENSGDGGICVGDVHSSSSCTNNILHNNNVTANNGTGIGVYSNYNILSANNISAASGQYAFKVSHVVDSYYNYIRRNNTANGEEVNYYYDEHDITIESKYRSAHNVSNVGKITLISCTNITVRGSKLSNNNLSSEYSCGIFLWNSDNNNLTNNTISNNYHGIRLHASSGNNITDLDTISPSYQYGARFEESSNYNSITDSSFAGIASTGMSISSSGHTNLADTTISSVASDGLFVSGSHYTNLTNVTVTSAEEDGVHLSVSHHVTISDDSSITANNTGVDCSGSNYTDILNSTITAGTDGIYMSESNWGNLTNNTIDATMRGIFLTESRDHNLTENNITNYTVTGILLLEYSTNIRMIGNDLTWDGSEFDIIINDSNDCVIANNESMTANYTFYLTNDTSLCTLDTVFNKTKVGYEDTSNLTMMWRIDVLCWDNYHIEEVWANLTVKYGDYSDARGAMVWDDEVPLSKHGRMSGNDFDYYGPPTSSDNWLPVIEYKENVTGKTTYQPINCTAINRWDSFQGINKTYRNLSTVVTEPGVTIIVDTGYTPNGKCYYCHLDKLVFKDTLHYTNYSSRVFDSLDEPYTPGRCIDCHNENDSIAIPHGNESGKDLLYQPSPQLCYSGTGDIVCHNASATQARLDQETEFSQTTHHPLGDGKLACKACHDNHGTDYDSDLLRYYRTSTSGNYNSDYYALCFVCHLEEKLVAKMINEGDSHLQKYTNQTNFRDEYYWVVGFGTGTPRLQNIHSPQSGQAGWAGHPNYHCYSCHNPHGSNNPATTRYRDKAYNKIFNYSYITNLTPPSEVDPDGETNWELLDHANWSNSTLNQAGGMYSPSSNPCGCHGRGLTSNRFTYRDPFVDYAPAGGPGCVECHDSGRSDAIRKIVNVSAIKIAMHTDLSKTFREGGILQGTGKNWAEWGDVRGYNASNISTDNAICWACHCTNGTPPYPDFHPDRTLNPYKCAKCHGPIDGQPPHTHGLVAAIDNHGPTTKGGGSVYIQTDVGTNGSCGDCHAPSVLPDSYIGDLEVWKYTPSKSFVDYTGRSTMGDVSHYGLDKAQGLALGIANPLFDTSDCLYCHCDDANGTIWGNAPNVSGNMYGADTSNLSECYTYCHILPDYLGSVNETNVPHFHNISLYAGGGPDCVVCHDDMGGSNPYGVQSRVNATSIAAGIHANMTNNTIELVPDIDPKSKPCWGCHQSDGTEPEGMGDRNGIVDPSKKPWTCEDCHCRSAEWNASTDHGETWLASSYPPNRLPPRIYTHHPNSSTLKTNVNGVGGCVDCHNNAIDLDHNDTAEKVLGNTIFSNVSHYGTIAGLVTPTEDCGVCHHNAANGTLWGGAPQNSHGNFANYSAADGCYACHVNGSETPVDFHADSLIGGNAGPDCLRCHDSTGLATGRRIDEGVFATAIHGSLNNATNESDLNRSCWVCHFEEGLNADEHSSRLNQPYRCYDCHNKVGAPFANVSAAPNAYNHFANGTNISAYWNEATDSESCMGCHNQSEMNYSFDENDTYATNFSITSHYGDNRTDLALLYDPANSTDYCAYCHVNASTPFVMESANSRNIRHAGAFNCSDSGCHGTGRLHEDTLTRAHTSGNCTDCHALYGVNRTKTVYLLNVTAMGLGVHAGVNENMTATAILEVGDGNNAKCWGCHVPEGAYPANGHEDTFNNDAYLCYECHNGTAAYANVTSATAVYNHFKCGINITARTVAATNSTSCGYGCHNLSTMKVPGFDASGNASYRLNLSQSSHYPRNRTDIANVSGGYSDCAWCHKDSDNEFATIFERSNTANISHATETSSCIASGCHNKGRIHDLNLSGGDAGDDCLRCHGKAGSLVSRRIDETAFETAIHGRVNDAASNLNRSCWACHFESGLAADEHATRKSPPYLCNDCHNSGSPPFGNVSAAPNVYNHYKSGTSIEAYWTQSTDSESCMGCHNESEMKYAFDENDTYSTNFSITSHYGDNRTDLVNDYDSSNSTDYCAYCHINGSTPFVEQANNRNIQHADGYDCNDCHGEGMLHNATLTRVETSANCTDCHALYGANRTGTVYLINVTAMNLGVHAGVNSNMSGNASAAGDANNAKCWGCHVVGGVYPADGHNDTINNGAYLCYDCHNGTAAYENVTSATAVYNHFKSGVNITARTVAETDSFSCGYGCHNLSTMKVPGFDDSGNASYLVNMSQASHYPRSRPDIANVTGGYSDCAWCHKNSTNEFAAIFERPSKANISHATETSSCIDPGCHNRGRIHDVSLAGGSAGSDCLKCHGRDGIIRSRRIDETAFETAIHGRVNGAASDLNKSCWVCHFEEGLNAGEHSARLVQPYRCYDCHNKVGAPFANVSTAPNAYNHFANGTNISAYWTQSSDSESCMGCHNESEMFYSFDENDTYRTNFSITSHYGDNRTDLVALYDSSNSTEYCAYCHINQSTPFMAQANDRNIQHAGAFNCSDAGCHGTGRLHEDTLTRAHTSGNCTDCHALYGVNRTKTVYLLNVTAMGLGVHAGVNSNMTATAVSVVGDGNNAKCWGCHVPEGAYPADGHNDTLNNDAYLCYECHNGTAAYANVTSATAVYNHFKSGRNITARTVAETDSFSCGYGCHNLSTMKVPGFDASGNASYRVNLSQSSHYPRNRTDIANVSGGYSDCAFCHKDSENEFAPIFERLSKANISHATETTSCITLGCHNKGRIHDLNLSDGDAGSDCLKCHGKTGLITSRRIDETAFETAIHGRVNDASTDLNRSCWVCHFEDGLNADNHSSRKSQPYLCNDCHNAGSPPFSNVSTAPNVYNHFKNGTSIEAYWTQSTDSESCMGCHNESEMKYVFDENDTYSTNFSITSHYGDNRTDIVALYDSSNSTDYCAYCHINGSTPFVEQANNRNIQHAGSQGCNDCHGDGRLHNETLTRVTTTGNCTDCHALYGDNTSQTRYHINVTAMNLGVHAGVNSNMTATATSEVADANNAKCWGCHVQNGVYPADGHGDIFNNRAYLCYECHNGTAAYENVTSATAVYNHFKSGNITARTVAETDSFSCGYGCHNLTTMKVPGFDDSGNASYLVNMSQASHYTMSRPDIANVTGGYSDCTFCHKNSTNEFAPIFERPSNANISHASETQSCITPGCHNRGRIHDMSLSGGDAGSDCLKCHGREGLIRSRRIDEATFGIAIHGRVNGAASDLNRSCWACHFDEGMNASDHSARLSQPYRCYDCHNKVGAPFANVSTAPNAYNHFKSGTNVSAYWTQNTDSESCMGCHNQTEMFYTFNENDTYRTNFSITSHYGDNRTDLALLYDPADNTNYCAYCHINTSTPFMEQANDKNIRHAGGQGCDDCHGTGRLHNETLTRVTTTGNCTDCHSLYGANTSSSRYHINVTAMNLGVHAGVNENMTSTATTEVADANNAKCWGCHVQDGAYPADGHSDIFNNDAYLCYECHNGTAAYQNVTSATAVYNHFKSGTNIRARTVAETDSFSCGYGCHNLSTMKVAGFNAGGNASYRVNLSQASHYPRNRESDIANVSGGYSDCGWCHLDPTNEFIDIFERAGAPNHTENIDHASKTSSCIVTGCHNRGRIHDQNLTFPNWDIGRECANCHLTGGANASDIVAIINKTGFEGSVHRNITGEYNASNYTAISRVCWGCHNNYTEQSADPTKHAKVKPNCEDCHDSESPRNAGNLSENLRQVTEHQPNGTDITTNATIANCVICHNRSLVTGMPPSELVVSGTAQNFISHYGRQRTDMIDGDVTNCSYCHCNETNMFADTFDCANNTNITHGGGYSANCTDCHGSGRFHDAALSAPMMTPGNNSLCMKNECHGNNQKSWFVDDAAFTTKIHGRANCTDCHAPLPIDVSGSVGAGGTYNRSFTVDADVKRLNVTLNWARGSLNLTLDANGTEINSSSAATDPNVEYNESGTTIRYTIENPANGSWVAAITNVSAQTSFNLDIEFIQKHPKTGECFANPCESCHVTDISYNAPPVAEHITSGTATSAGVWTGASCAACHDNDIALPSSIGGGGVDTSNEGAMTAHYGSHLTFDTAECIECHENEDTSARWGSANDPRNFTRHETARKVLRTGAVWRLKNEYEITVGPISSTGNCVLVNLTHLGAVVKTEFVADGGNFEYEVKGLSESGNTTICNLTVTDIFTSGLRGVVTLNGTVLASRIHIETEDADCYACHIAGYRYGVEGGDEYLVLRNDGEDVTIGKLAVNFTERERRIQRVGREWDLGYGYSLTVTELDLNGGKAHLELALNGTVLESKVVEEGGIFTYNTTVRDRKGHVINDVTVFQVRVAGVFRR